MFNGHGMLSGLVGLGRNILSKQYLGSLGSQLIGDDHPINEMSCQQLLDRPLRRNSPQLTYLNGLAQNSKFSRPGGRGVCRTYAYSYHTSTMLFVSPLFRSLRSSAAPNSMWNIWFGEFSDAQNVRRCPLELRDPPEPRLPTVALSG